MLKKSVWPLAILFVCYNSFATPVAVLDSGIDVDHFFLKPHLQRSLFEIPNNNIDDDQNGYVDDIVGWNFSENTNIQANLSIIPPEYSDYVKGFSILMLIQSDIRPANDDFNWIREKWLGSGNEVFKEGVSMASQFAHGSHVAGIVLRESDFSADIISLQIMKSVSFDLDIKSIEATVDNVDKEESSEFVSIPDEEFIDLFKEWASKNKDSWFSEIEMLNARGVRIANCSFGTGFYDAKRMMSKICKEAKTKCDDDRLTVLARAFLKYYKRPGSMRLISTNPDILFAVAAGNDSSDNDIFPDEPANLNAKNLISVASVNKYRSALSDFSNFGKIHVDIAAPGEVIESAYPANHMGLMSGTSQATPYVTGVAAKMLDINPDLSAVELKHILMKTVDKKVYLRDITVSGGVINKPRALQVAHLTKNGSSVEYAIRHSNVTVKDVEIEIPKSGIPFKMDLPKGMKTFIKELIQNAM